MNKELPSSPNLLHLKHQAKEWQKAYHQHDESACQRVQEHHPYIDIIDAVSFRDIEAVKKRHGRINGSSN